MNWLLYFYITMLCVSLPECRKHFIIETKDEAPVTLHDDIQTSIVPLFNGSSSGDYGVQNDCAGIRLTCKAPSKRNILEDTCVFT